MDELLDQFVWEISTGRKTMLQVERHLHKCGWSEDMVKRMMQRIADKISERKKGNG